MDLQIPPHAAAEHRGSYSSIRSAAGIWTPPHSPHSPSTDIHMDTEPIGPAVYPSGQHGGYEGYKSAEGHESLKGLKGVEGPRAHEDLEDPNTPHVNPIKVENMADAMNQEPARHESPDILEGNANHHDHSGQPAQVEEQPTELRLSDFEVVDTLGTGTFGRVLLVRLRPPPQHANAQDQDQAPAQHFAMKVLKKTDVVRLRQVEHVNAERFILARIRHPFIVDLYATFQDNLNIYMLLSYVPGGELFSHLRRAGRFSADVTRFYLAIIVLALRYLHSYNIIYRDLKPENLLLDHRGYLRITDFGFAKVVDDRTWTLCGTPEYLAPEIIQSDGHGKAVDWWACGILCYEMLVGYPPFYDDNAFGIYEKILQGKINYPQHVDPLSRDLIRAFLHPDRSKRLGNLIGGTDDVLLHPWFRGVDWGMLERCEIRAPILPQVTSSGDTRNFSRLPMVNASDIPGLAGEPVPHNTQDIYAAQFADF